MNERRRLMGGDKKPYDARILYLESTGTQYIDLGLQLFTKSSGDLLFEVKVNVPGSGQTDNACILNAMYEVSPYPGAVLRYYGGYIQYAASSVSSHQTGNTDMVQDLRVSVNRSSSSVHSTSTTLFAGYDGSGNPWRYIKMKLYGCRIYDEGLLVCDLIPVRKGGTGYMYDRVTGQLFGNLGTGSFICGSDNELTTKWVDLGLPSGLLWAKTNLGAEHEWEAGFYYSWGNTEGHEASEGYDFSSTNYNASTGGKLRRTMQGGGDEDFDPVTAISDLSLNAGYHTPSQNSFTELVNNTDHEWVSDYNGTGVSGYKFMHKSDHSVYIFIPAVGAYNGTTFSADNNDYWTDTRYDGDTNDRSNARFFYISESEIKTNQYFYQGNFGLQIRPVKLIISYPEKNLRPLQFKTFGSGTIGWKANNSDNVCTIKYSLNGSAWTNLTSTTSGVTFNVSAGDVVKFSVSVDTNPGSSSGRSIFTSSVNFNAEGNIMSITKSSGWAIPSAITDDYKFRALFYSTKIRYADKLILPAHTLSTYCYYGTFQNCTELMGVPNLPATTLGESCYQAMFYGCSSLAEVPKKMLPATTLTNRCYYYMFTHCTSLTTVPELPATTMKDYCYQSIFEDCTSLTTVPSDLLPATTLANSCYRGIFYQCTNLTTAPELPATTLVDNCYYHLFCGCTSLNYIKCLATNMSATNCLYNWVEDVAQSGTFVKASGVSWPSGTSGIPSGWTVEEV